jgi:phosphatidylinositol-3-phosphatase
MAGLGRWRAVVAIVLVVAAGLTGWSSTGFDRTPPPAPSRVRPRGPAGQPATRPGARASRPSHLIVVVEENHSLEQIIGSPAAPFLNHLAAHGTLLTDYHASTHPSLPNYVALLGGRTSRIQSDCVHCTISGPTLIDQLQARHISWAAYLQGLPRPCSAVASAGAYTEAVDPFIHAVRVRDDPARCDRVLPFRFLHTDLAAGRLPTVFFVVPRPLPRHALPPGPGRRSLASPPGRRAGGQPGLAAGHPPGGHLRREHPP